MICTTVNLDKLVVERLFAVSTQSRIPVYKIANLLIKKIVREMPIRTRLFSTVKYQRRGAGGNWHVLHLEFEDYVHEACIDLRKLFKMSVSGILAMAVELYLEEIIIELETIRKSTDNYSFHYSFQEKLIAGVSTTFQVMLKKSKGKPPYLEKTIFFS